MDDFNGQSVYYHASLVRNPKDIQSPSKATLRLSLGFTSSEGSCDMVVSGNWKVGAR